MISVFLEYSPSWNIRHLGISAILEEKKERKRASPLPFFKKPGQETVFWFFYLALFQTYNLDGNWQLNVQGIQHLIICDFNISESESYTGRNRTLLLILHMEYQIPLSAMTVCLTTPGSQHSTLHCFVLSFMHSQNWKSEI